MVFVPHIHARSSGHRSTSSYSSHSSYSSPDHIRKMNYLKWQKKRTYAKKK